VAARHSSIELPLATVSGILGPAGSAGSPGRAGLKDIKGSKEQPLITAATNRYESQGVTSTSKVCIRFHVLYLAKCCLHAFGVLAHPATARVVATIVSALHVTCSSTLLRSLLAIIPSPM
jgi:hypothetical protein